MLTDGCTDGRMDDGRKVITIAHPEQSSGELKICFVELLSANAAPTSAGILMYSDQQTEVFKDSLTN